MIHVLKIVVALGLATFVWGTRLAACPLCYSDNAKLVRAGLLDTAGHWPAIVALLGPFLCLALIVFGLDGWSRVVPKCVSRHFDSRKRGINHGS